MNADLLFEVGCEEIPAAPLDGALQQLRESAGKMLDDLRLAHGEVQVFGTPRRLVVYAHEVTQTQEPFSESRRGPAARAAFDDSGAPTQAAIGFARAQSVPVESLEVRDEGQGEYVYVALSKPGLPAADVLPDALRSLVLGLSFPKTMRWGTGSLRFVRPIRWIVALLGSEVLPVELDGVIAGRETFGHRFLSPGPFVLDSADAYMVTIGAQAKVVLDPDVRSTTIREGICAVTYEKGWQAVLDDPPFSEVVNLVEAPGVLLGSFKEEHAGLPREVLTTAMESHQRYFPVEDAQGRLAPGFVVVHNGDPAAAETIIRGHERVLQARLADAEFFFGEDRKQPLAARVERLKSLVFQDKLGSVFDKTQRMQGIAHYLGRALSVADDVQAAVERAALLAKTDLVTDMVVEFPALQGVMGREYARLDGEPDAVAEAIYEHYLPRAAMDALPQTPAGQIVAVADKIDTIVGCFAVGLIPSGSEDPYALRRQGLGIVRICVENRLAISVPELLDAALSHYGTVLHNLDLDGAPRLVTDFLSDRFKSYELTRGFRYDRIDAVIASGVDEFVSAHERVVAISGFLVAPEASDLLVGFTRAANLAQPDLGTAADAALMAAAELELLEAVRWAHQESQTALAEGDYAAALKSLAGLREPVDRFFVDVLVMDPDESLRQNRLRLLNRLVSVFTELADFSKIVES